MDSEERAIPFIVKNQTTQMYQLSNEAEIFLKNINNPLSIVTVAGLYRTGKSYLLNRVILNKSHGFNVGPTINPCTKGLWIWNKALRTQDGKSMLVVDTQGLGALDQQTNHDMKIFSLAVLLSTTFIYNSVGNIDQNALQTLSLVLNLVGSIDNQQQSSRPSFIWVIRDFSLQLIDEKGNTISPKQYLQMALNADGMKQTQKFEIRKNITNAFSERDCFTLYKPLIDQNKLQKLDTIPLQQLRPEFVSQTMALRKKVFNNVKQLKLANSKGLKGYQYVIMIKKYLSSINEGKLPNMIDTWSFIKQEKGRVISEELIQFFLQKIRSQIKLPMKFFLLEESLNVIWNQMLTQFKNKTYEDTSTQQISDFFQRIKTEIKASNQEQMKSFLKSTLNKQFQPFSKKIYSSYYDSIESFTQDIDKNFKQNILSKYSDSLQGLNASISSFLQRKYIDVFKYLSTKMKNQIKKLQLNQEQIQNSYKKQLQEQKNTSLEYQSQLKRKITQLDKKLIEITNNYQNNEKVILQQKQSRKNKQLQIKMKLQNLQELLQITKQENEEYLSQKNKLQKQIFVIKKENDKQIALLQQKNDYLQRKAQQQSARYEQMKQILDEKNSVYQQEKKKFFSTNENKVKSLLQQNQQKSQKIYDLQHNLLELKEEYTQKLRIYQQTSQKLMEQKQSIKQNLTNNISATKQSHLNQISELRDQCHRYQEQLEVSMLQKNDLENKVKQLYQQLKHAKFSSQKQIAIHLQRIQFQQVQIKQLKTNGDDIKKNYQAMIQNLQQSMRNIEEKHKSKINELSEQYDMTYKAMDKEFNDKMYQMKKELQIVKASKEDLQIQLSLERKRFQAKEKQFKQSYSKIQYMYKGLSQKFANSEKDFQDLSKQKQSYFIMRIKQLEKQIQEVKEKSMRELQQSQRSSQQALAILKNYTQIQRQQWQKRLLDQKQKNNKNINSLKESYQKKILQEKQILEDQNASLQQKNDQMQKYFNEALQSMKYDHDIEVQKLSNQFMQQKMQINKKNSLLTQEIQLTKMNMQNQIDQLKRTYEANTQNMKRELENELKQQQFKFKEQKQFLQSKYQSLRKSNKSVEQQNLILKNQLDKEKAVYREKQSSYLRNIDDLQERLSHQLFNHTKTIQEITNANNTQRKRLNAQIDALKHTKATLEDEKYSLEMQKQAIQTKLNSKLTYLQNRVATHKNQYDDLLNKFQITSSFLNTKLQNVQKQRQQLSQKLKNEFQQQLGIKEDNWKKQLKEYNDRIYRLQTENKSLRDKIILLQIKLSSESKMNHQNFQIEKMEEMKQEYVRRENDLKKLIEKLKRQNKKLKDQKEVLEASNTYQKEKNVNFQQRTAYKDRSQRDSIINGLSEYSRQDYNSRSRVNLDNSKIMNTSNLNQSHLNHSRISALGENKNFNNRKSNVSPMVTNKKYGNGHYGGQEDYSETRYY